MLFKGGNMSPNLMLKIYPKSFRQNGVLLNRSLIGFKVHLHEKRKPCRGTPIRTNPVIVARHYLSRLTDLRRHHK
jgi:hypothetical protein